MDKTNDRIYSNETQSISVESHFTGTDSIHTLIKRFLAEQANRKMKAASTAPPQYDGSGTVAAAAPAREDRE